MGETDEDEDIRSEELSNSEDADSEDDLDDTVQDAPKDIPRKLASLSPRQGHSQLNKVQHFSESETESRDEEQSEEEEETVSQVSSSVIILSHEVQIVKSQIGALLGT